MKKCVFFLSLLLIALIGFSELVIYSSVDEANARKILSAFSAETGIKLNFVFLSSGPAMARIEAEKNNPQADVWLERRWKTTFSRKKKG